MIILVFRFIIPVTGMTEKKWLGLLKFIFPVQKNVFYSAMGDTDWPNRIILFSLGLLKNDFKAPS